MYLFVVNVVLFVFTNGILNSLADSAGGSGPSPRTDWVGGLNPSSFVTTELALVSVMVMKTSSLVIPLLLLMGCITASRSPIRTRSIYALKPTVLAPPTPPVRRLPDAKQSRDKPAPLDFTRRNRQEVVGWELAEQVQLRELAPERLQAILDNRNPFSDRITQCLQTINDLQGNSSLRAVIKHAKVEKRLHQLRLAPVLIHQRDSLTVADKLLHATDAELENIVPEVLNTTGEHLPVTPPTIQSERSLPNDTGEILSQEDYRKLIREERKRQFLDNVGTVLNLTQPRHRR